MKPKNKPNPTNQTILLSYPKSGNHFIRFLLEYISGRPTRGCVDNPHKDRSICYLRFTNPNLLNHVNKQKDYIALKCHTVREIRAYYPKHQRLILIVRNYRDAIYRFRRRLDRAEIDHYLSLIKYYHLFKGPKLLIYYEDLVSQTESVVKQLAKFLGLKTKKLTEFLANPDKVVAESKQCLSGLDSYRNIHQGQATQDYEDRVPESQLVPITKYLKSQSETLQKYLDRYG